MKFSAQILDMVIVIRDFNFEKENKEMKESNCLLDWVSNCKLSLNSLEKDIKAAQTRQILISCPVS